MAEQTRAERLRGEMAKALKFYGKKCLKYRELCDETTDAEQIVQACKEAGLMFTNVGVKGDLEGACICKVEKIEL